MTKLELQRVRLGLELDTVNAIREGCAANRRGPEAKPVAEDEDERKRVLSNIPAPAKLELL